MVDNGWGLGTRVSASSSRIIIITPFYRRSSAALGVTSNTGDSFRAVHTSCRTDDLPASAWYVALLPTI